MLMRYEEDKNGIWPFPDAPSTMVFSTRDIEEGKSPVLHVTHDLGDGAWQFRTTGAVPIAEGRIAALQQVVFHDPSLLELADLPPGWMAVRTSPDSPWNRQPVLTIAGRTEASFR